MSCCCSRNRRLPRRPGQLLAFRPWDAAWPVSRPDRQPAIGLPGDYQDRACTHGRRRASDQVMTAACHPGAAPRSSRRTATAGWSPDGGESAQAHHRRLGRRRPQARTLPAECAASHPARADRLRRQPVRPLPASQGRSHTYLAPRTTPGSLALYAPDPRTVPSGRDKGLAGRVPTGLPCPAAHGLWTLIGYALADRDHRRGHARPGCGPRPSSCTRRVRTRG